MKSIDWKSVVRDCNLCEQFTVAVHNRFCILRDELEDNNNTSAVYDTLITANKEIALEMLPKKRKSVVAIATSKSQHSQKNLEESFKEAQY